MQHKFSALDTLRTLMALSVATGHYFYWNGTATKFPWAFFLAVDFFFILSGFVLTRSILNDKNGSSEAFLRGFVIKRVYRLFPLYLLLFVPATALLVYTHGSATDPAYYFVTSAFLLQAMGFDAGAKFIYADTSIGIAWSISVEFWVGLLWFPLVYALRKRPSLLALVSLGTAIAAFVLIINFSPNTLNVNLQRFAGVITFGALRGVLGFALGTLSVVSFDVMRRTSPNAARDTVVEVLAVTALCVLYLRNNYTHQNEFVAPLIFSALIVSVAHGGGLISKVLALPAWAPARPLSYAIYLVHPFFVFAWREMGIAFSHQLLPLYLILTCVSAFFLYKFVEAPWIERGRNVLYERLD